MLRGLSNCKVLTQYAPVHPWQHASVCLLGKQRVQQVWLSAGLGPYGGKPPQTVIHVTTAGAAAVGFWHFPGLAHAIDYT